MHLQIIAYFDTLCLYTDILLLFHHPPTIASYCNWATDSTLPFDVCYMFLIYYAIFRSHLTSISRNMNDATIRHRQHATYGIIITTRNVDAYLIKWYTNLIAPNQTIHQYKRLYRVGTNNVQCHFLFISHLVCSLNFSQLYFFSFDGITTHDYR